MGSMCGVSKKQEVAEEGQRSRARTVDTREQLVKKNFKNKSKKQIQAPQEEFKDMEEYNSNLFFIKKRWKINRRRHQTDPVL